ncbi:hypothetical protein ACIBKY_51430 [Nonomuraea sp. NPDC050394]|uniref:hypothetical protein n=1 Tax=Nonomuraea sp. NPDC050394 TaxID=3364363 RepID=UPI003798EFD4
MNETPIPRQLRHLPHWNGLLIPAITIRHRDNTPILGEVDFDKVATFLRAGLCQLCGEPLGKPTNTAVAMVRPADMMRGWINEPAQHRWCADYSRQSCPMLAGRLDRYRQTPRSARRCGDPLCLCDGWTADNVDGVIRSGQAADPWYAVSFPASSYRLAYTARGELRGVLLKHLKQPKIELVTRGNPGADDLALIVALGLPW